MTTEPQASTTESQTPTTESRTGTAEYQPGVRALLCTEDGGLQPPPGLDEIGHFLAVEKNLLWLDIDTAHTRDLSLLKREFGFHDLALEDALRPKQRPKIEQFQSYTFLIFYAISLRRGAVRAAERERRGTPAPTGRHPTRDLLQPHQVALFVGVNFLVTVHHGPLAELEEVAGRWRDNIRRIERSIDALVYSLLDTLVDEYFPLLDEVADLVENIEQSVFERFNEAALTEIFALKKALLTMRRVVAPERDVLNVLIRRDAPVFGEASLIYFQDVYDHVVRVTDSIDVYRDLLSSALDAYLSVSANRLNEVVKRLTSWTIPLMAGALLAGIWGMNFRHMPELEWRLGYPLGLATIGVAMAGIALYFRHRHWL